MTQVLEISASLSLLVSTANFQAVFHRHVHHTMQTGRNERTSCETDCVKSQVILIRGFHFIVLTHPHTYTPTHTHRDKMIAVSAPPYYDVGTDNNCYNQYKNFTHLLAIITCFLVIPMTLCCNLPLQGMKSLNYK